MARHLGNLFWGVSFLTRVGGVCFLYRLRCLTEVTEVKVVLAGGPPGLEDFLRGVGEELEANLEGFLALGVVLLGGTVGLDFYRLTRPAGWAPPWYRVCLGVGSAFTLGGPLGAWPYLSVPPLYRDVLARVGPYRVVDAVALGRKREHTLEDFREGCLEGFRHRGGLARDLEGFTRDLGVRLSDLSAELTDGVVTSSGMAVLLGENPARVADFVGAWSPPPPWWHPVGYFVAVAGVVLVCYFFFPGGGGGGGGGDPGGLRVDFAALVVRVDSLALGVQALEALAALEGARWVETVFGDPPGGGPG